jgi:hypothetical protein
MAYGNNTDGSRRLGDYISRVVDAISSQDGVALAELLAVSGGSYCDFVASALDITKVGLICLLRERLCFCTILPRRTLWQNMAGTNARIACIYREDI